MPVTFKLKLRISSFLIVLLVASVVIFPNGSTVMKAVKVVFVSLSVVYILGLKKRIKWSKYYYWLLLVNSYAAISVTWADSRSFAVADLTTVTLNVICVSCFLQLLMLQKNLYVTAYKVYAVVPIIGFSILIFQYGSMVFEGLREIPDSRHNALGLFAGIGAFLAYILRDESKRKWTCIVVLNIIVALCTSSRKAMLYLVLPFIIYYLLSARLNVKFLRNIVLIFCGLIIGYYAIMNIPFLYKIMGSGVESILNSIFDDSLAMDASFSGRLRRITWGMQWFHEQPFLGHGIGNFKYFYSHYVNKVTMQIVADNNFIDELVNGGIVGFAIYYSMHLVYIWRTLKYKKSLKMTASVGFCILVTLLVGDYGSSSYQYLHSQLYLALATYSMTQNTKWINNSRRVMEENDGK